LPAYSVLPYDQLRIQVTVSNHTYQSPLALFSKINDQQMMIEGQLSLNFNSFSSYISLLSVTPSGWGSEDAFEIYYQIRFQEAKDQYRVIMC